ncbi:MAG: hypothetical protein AAF065_09985 [Verrucomicrobiota bacterium]
MKYSQLLLLSLLITLLGSTLHGSERKTANYYLSVPQKHLSQEIGLNVTHVSPIHHETNDEYVTFNAHTLSGNIRLIVRHDETSSLISKVGLNPKSYFNGTINKRRSKSVRGTFVKLGNHYMVVIGGALEDLANENPEAFQIQSSTTHIFDVANVGQPDAAETREDLISFFNMLNNERSGRYTGEGKIKLTRDEFVTRLKKGETFRVTTKNKNMKFFKKYQEPEEEKEEEEGALALATGMFKEFSSTGSMPQLSKLVAAIDPGNDSGDEDDDESDEDEDEKESDNDDPYIVELVYGGS